MATAVGVLPLLPVLPRLLGAGSHVGALGDRLTMTDEPRLVLSAIEGMTLHFPMVFGDDRIAKLSTAILHAQAAIAAIGLVLGWASREWRPVWLGIGLSAALNVTSALFYSGPLNWHYFTALMPALCLCIGHATACVRRWRPAAVFAMSALAAMQLLMLKTVDDRVLESGVIKINPRWLTGGAGPDVEGYAMSIRELARVGHALQSVIPDGTTALLAAHGVRGEMWRETGAEFMKASRAPIESPVAFMLTGPGAEPLRPDARLIAERVCLFDRSNGLTWRLQHAMPPAGWERADFADNEWTSLELPRRVARPSRSGPLTQLVSWSSPRLLLRGRYTPTSQSGRHLLAVVIRSAGNSSHWISQAFVNGMPVAITRNRVFYSTTSRHEEWLIDVTDRIQPADNAIALMLDGQMPIFDLDIFELPCLDAEWYR